MTWGQLPAARVSEPIDGFESSASTEIELSGCSKPGIASDNQGIVIGLTEHFDWTRAVPFDQ